MSTSSTRMRGRAHLLELPDPPTTGFPTLALGAAALVVTAIGAYAQASAPVSTSAVGTTASHTVSSSKNASDDSVVWNELSSNGGDLRGKLPQLLKVRMDSAHAQGRTMFVEVGATWCPPCLELEANLKKPEFIDAFAGTSIVHLDANEWDIELDMGPIGIKGGGLPIIIAMGPKLPKATEQLNGVINAAEVKKFLNAHLWSAATSQSDTSLHSKQK